MDLRNVTNLTIQEGGVRTIHDKDGRQLWGKLNYNTTYRGDTTQQPNSNPDSPQPINIATGTQTITVMDDGQQAEAYIVDLGNIELCKLGNAQDYIYKNAESWFVHKATGKIILDGSSDESWIRQSSSTTPPENRWFQYTVSDMSTSLSPLEINSSVFANEFATTYPTGINYTTTVEGFFIMNSSGQLRVRWDMSTIESLTNWRTWLSSHPITLYYPLATASDNQITDSTLITQLEAIHQFLTRYGYSATVSGNLPLIIDKTNL